MRKILKYGMAATGWLLMFGGVGTMDVDPTADIKLQLLVVSIGIILYLFSEKIDILAKKRVVIKVVEPNGRLRVIRGCEYTEGK